MATVNTIDVSSVATPGGRFAVSTSSFLRPNNTTAYTALDVISCAAADTSDAGSDAALVFPGVGRSGMVRAVTVSNRLETDTVTPRLFLFDAEPTNFDDNAALALVTADLPKWVGRIDFTELDKLLVGTLTNVYEGVTILDHATLAPQVRPITMPYSCADGKLYGLLQTVTGYTPIALTSFVVRVMVEHD